MYQRVMKSNPMLLFFMKLYRKPKNADNYKLLDNVASSRCQNLPREIWKSRLQTSSLTEHIFSVRPYIRLSLLDRGKVQEVTGSVDLVVELLGVRECELVAHVRVVSHPHEVIVPGSLSGHHEEPEEAIREQHLDLLVVRGQVALRVVALVSVGPAPLGAGGEGAGDDHRFLAVQALCSAMTWAWVQISCGL